MTHIIWLIFYEPKIHNFFKMVEHVEYSKGKEELVQADWKHEKLRKKKRWENAHIYISPVYLKIV